MWRCSTSTCPPSAASLLRIGLHVGDIVIDGDDILGDGVNVAARLETLAEPGGVVISRAVHEQVQGRDDVTFDDMGDQSLKNIVRPVRAFRAIQATGVARSQVAAPLALPDRPSIAVLPFENIGGDAGKAYFSDGIAEDIITGLSQLRWLFVIARNSTFSYQGRHVDIRQIGRELGVRYVLEGSVRWVRNRVRVTGQLIEAATGTHIWAERYDRLPDEVFEIQDEITASVIGCLQPELLSAEHRRVRLKPPHNLDAWENFVTGMFCTASTPTKAREMHCGILSAPSKWMTPTPEPTGCAPCALPGERSKGGRTVPRPLPLAWPRRTGQSPAMLRNPGAMLHSA